MWYWLNWRKLSIGDKLAILLAPLAIIGSIWTIIPVVQSGNENIVRNSLEITASVVAAACLILTLSVFTRHSISKRRRKYVNMLFEEAHFPKESIDSFMKLKGLRDNVQAAQIWIEHKLIGTNKYNNDIADKILHTDISKPGSIEIDVSDCFTITKNSHKIHKYFSALSKMSKYNKGNDHIVRAGRFLCKIHIAHSFLSPRFLLHGIMAAFGDEWEPVVNSYGRDVSARPAGRDERFEAFRIFQFDCWLVWGPSIPLCECHKWADRNIRSLQIGFGDENNSIDLLYESGDSIKGEFDRRFSQQPAIPSSIKGILRSPSSVADSICGCQQETFCLETQEGNVDNKSRLVLELSTDDSRRFEISKIARHHARHYYSAYIWIMFSLAPAPLTPEDLEHNCRSENGEWTDILPFFVHGNVADHDTAMTYKKMLIGQLRTQIKDILTSYGGVNLRYECAFDDSSEGRQMLQFGSPDQESLHALLTEAVAADTGLKGYQDSGRLIVPPRAESVADARYRHSISPYSACKLPGIIGRYYQQLRQSRTTKKQAHEPVGPRRQSTLKAMV